MKLTFAITSLAALAAAADPLAAQGRGNGARGVPPGHMPPPGMCRVWYDGVPPGRQPAPTSCARAERAAGRNARVIYGPRADRRDDRYDRRDDGRYDPRRGADERRRVDDRRRGSDCVDRNRDGRCDPVYGGVAGRGGSSLPMMPTVSELRSGRLSSDQRRWLGTSNLRPQHLDRNRDGRPEVVIWRDSRDRIVQRWFDTDGDRRVERVVFYDERGKVVREAR